MSSFSQSPKLLKAGLVLIDPESAAVQRIIALIGNKFVHGLKRTVKQLGGTIHTTGALTNEIIIQL
jgi:hypothetical protein